MRDRSSPALLLLSVFSLLSGGLLAGGHLLSGCLDFDGAKQRQLDGGGHDRVADIVPPPPDDARVDASRPPPGDGGADGQPSPAQPEDLRIGERSATRLSVLRRRADRLLLSEVLVTPGGITSVTMHTGGNLLAPLGAQGKQELCSGVSYFDYAYSWQGTGNLSVQVENRVVVQVKGTWTPPVAGQMSGTTTFTFLPDGRIHRHEEVRVEEGHNGFLLAYMALDRARMNQGVFIPVSNTYLPLSGPEWNGPGTFACALATDGIAGWAQGAAAGNVNNNNVFFIRVWDVAETTPPSYLMASDWVRLGDVAVGTYSGNLLMYFEDRLTCPGSCACVGDVAGLVSGSALLAGDGSPTYQPAYGFYVATYTGSKMIWSVTSGQAATAVFRIDGGPNEPMAVTSKSRGKLPFAAAVEGGVLWVYLPRGAGGLRASDSLTLSF